MIVTKDTCRAVVDKLLVEGVLAVDTETTGLRPYHGSRLFSVIVSSSDDDYYFNFQAYSDVDPNYVLGAEELSLLKMLFSLPKTWVMHNAKYDMSILANEGISFGGKIHDTMVVGRLLDSEAKRLTLDALAEKIGYRKDDTVKKHIIKNKLYTFDTIPGKKVRKKNLNYAKVPWSMIVPYGLLDGRITYRLYKYQQDTLKSLIDATPPQVVRRLDSVYENECELLKVVYAMEQRGVAIDIDFCKRAVAAKEELSIKSQAEFKKLTGIDFKDSMEVYKLAFKDETWEFGKPTAKGKVNPTFDSEVLEKFKHPAARCVLDYRKSKSDVNFFLGFLYEADANGVIHTSFNQHGTVTGRFSSSNPNLQNLTKNEDTEQEEFLVRRAIVPRPGNVFHMLDYDQMEYRLMLDYAAVRYARDKGDDEGVRALIKKVLGGLDVHQATADISNTTRREAKTTNFGVLYGRGKDALAAALGVTVHRAEEIKAAIFAAAPEIRSLIRDVQHAAKIRGFIINWFGRWSNIEDPDKAFRGTNYLIQGGCADIVKVAMVRINKYLGAFQTRLVLTIHDELVLEGPPEEAAIVVPEVKRIMESVYHYHFIPLTCGVDHSFKSLADKQEGVCIYERTA
jgi:DNA polymerase-1